MNPEEFLTWPRCNACDMRTNPDNLTEIPVIQDDGFLYTYRICGTCEWEMLEGIPKHGGRVKHYFE